MAHRDRLRDQRGGGQREPAALADAAHRDPRRAGQLAGRLDRQHRVGEQPGVVIALRLRDAPGHHPGVLRPRGRVALAVAGGAGGPPAALAPGVHHEHGVAEGGQQRVLGGQAPAASVADELHHHLRLPVRARGSQVPGPDAIAARPGEFGVEHLDRRVGVGFVPGQRRRADRRAGLVEAPPPPQVEVRRLRGIRAIFAQLVQWQVKPGHSSLRPVKAPESSPTIFLVTADPEARGDQWPRAPGVYRNRGHGDGIHGDGMYADGTDGSRRRRGVRSPPRRRAHRPGPRPGRLRRLRVRSGHPAAAPALHREPATPDRGVGGHAPLADLPAGRIFPASVSYQLPGQGAQGHGPAQPGRAPGQHRAAGIGLRQGRDQRVGRRGAAQERVRGGAQGDLRRRHPELRDDRRRRRAAERGRRRQRGRRDDHAAAGRGAAGQRPAGCRPASWSSGSTARAPAATTTTGRSPTASRPARTSSCTPPGTPTAGRGCR